MDIWENTVLTDKGRVLQAKLLQGQTLKSQELRQVPKRSRLWIFGSRQTSQKGDMI